MFDKFNFYSLIRIFSFVLCFPFIFSIKFHLNSQIKYNIKNNYNTGVIYILKKGKLIAFFNTKPLKSQYIVFNKQTAIFISKNGLIYPVRLQKKEQSAQLKKIQCTQPVIGDFNRDGENELFCFFKYKNTKLPSIISYDVISGKLKVMNYYFETYIWSKSTTGYTKSDMVKLAYFHYSMRHYHKAINLLFNNFTSVETEKIISRFQELTELKSDTTTSFSLVNLPANFKMEPLYARISPVNEYNQSWDPAGNPPDTFLEMEIDGIKYVTPVIQDTLQPSWHTQFNIKLFPFSRFVITTYDKDSLNKKTIISKKTIRITKELPAVFKNKEYTFSTALKFVPLLKIKFKVISE